jgi:hypothetical protein
MNKTIILALASASLVMYVYRLMIAGDMLNDKFNGTNETESAVRGDENRATAILVQTTMIVGMIGSASAFAGLFHWSEWTDATRLVGTGVGLIACTLDLLVMGYASKQWDLGCRTTNGCTDSHLNWRAQMIGFCAVISVVLQAAYVGIIFTTLDEAWKAPAPAPPAPEPTEETEENPAPKQPLEQM